MDPRPKDQAPHIDQKILVSSLLPEGRNYAQAISFKKNQVNSIIAIFSASTVFHTQTRTPFSYLRRLQNLTISFVPT